MPFEHILTVRFHETDRAGIAFFGRVFQYAHDAFEELLAAAGTDLHAFFDDVGVGLPLVHAEADFQGPMRLGDRLRIALTCARLGRGSVTLRATLTGADDGRPRAVVTLVHAGVRLSDFTPCPVPDAFRDLLERQGLTRDGVPVPDDDGGADA